MGIYIKGMEMPTTGLYFVSVDNSNGFDKTVVTVERMLGNRDVRQIIGSYEAVPVQPHGDLVDANDLLHDKQGQKLFRGDFRIAFNQIIERAPTIIPAEEGIGNED